MGNPVSLSVTGSSGGNANATIADRLFAALQWLLPTRLLSRLMHGLAGARHAWLKRLLIGAFQRLYRIDLAEAADSDPEAYPSFNALFTRALRDGARPMPEDADAVASPVDGCLGASGEVRAGVLLQAKGTAYRVPDLLGDETAAAPFLGGSYATLYLAPHDYHRVHMPITGTLRETRYLPGRLFGVNPASVRAIPRLFTRNERLVCLFDTAAGPMALVLVGAFCVGGIETVWSGPVTPPHRRRSALETFPADGDTAIRLVRGAELGRFNLGSTVILLFGAGALGAAPGAAMEGETVRLGQRLATLAYGA